MTGLATAWALATGCGKPGLTEVQSAGQLRQIIADSDRPVVVEFSKEWCDHCGGLEITLRHLSAEYAGRIQAVKFVLLRADGACVDQPLADEHNILYYPTVVFFVKGREARRFEQHYTYSDYEEAIKSCVPTTQPSGAG